MGQLKKEIKNREQFAEDMTAGMSINGLAQKHDVTWQTAREEMKKILAETNGEAPAEDVQAEGPEAFDITLNLPSAGILELLRGIDPTEIMDAIEKQESQTHASLLQAVIQTRFDKELAKTRIVPLPLALVVGD